MSYKAFWGKSWDLTTPNFTIVPAENWTNPLEPERAASQLIFIDKAQPGTIQLKQDHIT